MLEGGHGERRVIIVDVDGYGVQLKGKEGQDFVFNAAYARSIYTEITELLQKIGIEVTSEEMIKTSDEHLHQTAKDLAK